MGHINPRWQPVQKGFHLSGCVPLYKRKDKLSRDLSHSRTINIKYKGYLVPVKSCNPFNRRQRNPETLH